VRACVRVCEALVKERVVVRCVWVCVGVFVHARVFPSYPHYHHLSNTPTQQRARDFSRAFRDTI